MSVYKILISAKDAATNEFKRVQGAIKRAGLAIKDVGDHFGFTEKKLNRFLGRFVGFAAVAGVASKAIGAMKSELVDSVKAYEDFARATNIPDENIKKLDELKEKHELMRIEVGEKLMPYWISLQGAATRWLEGVGILIDKMEGLKKAPVNQAQWAAVPSDAPLKDISDKKPALNATTAAQRKAEATAKEYRQKHIGDLAEYGKILTEQERIAVKAQEKINDEWVKKHDEADETIRKAEEKFREDRERLSKEEEDKQIEALNRMYEAREESEQKTTEMIRKQEEMRSNIRQSAVNGAISVSNTLSQLIDLETSKANASKEEQKRHAVSIATINYVMGLAGSSASIWTSSGGSWQEKLAENIAIHAALGASFILQMEQIRSAAKGADFIARGPQLLMVGDNPTRRERVRVDPIGSPNVNGSGSGGGLTVHINDAMTGDKFIRLMQRVMRDTSGRNMISDLKQKLAAA